MKEATMRKLIITSVLGRAMLLSGCATLQQPGGLEALVKQVQAQAAQLCSFIPLASTVTAIFTAGQFVGAFEIANAIVTAVTAPLPPTVPGTKAAPRRAPTVSGVQIKGTFVGRK